MDPENEGVVGVMDLLSAMSQSLLDVQEEEKKVIIKDTKKFHLKTQGRPPKQIFYRDSIVIQSKPPPVHKKELCTTRFVCHGALATIKCLTCAMTDPAGVGYYCNACFKQKHPWYRVEHIHTEIDQSENIRNSQKLQDSQLEKSRQLIDGQNTLDRLRQQLTKLDEVSDDIKVDTEIRGVARRSVQLETKLASMRRELRKDVRGKGGVITLNDDEAAVKVQRIYRGYRLRGLISAAYAMRTVRVLDKDSGKEFYFDRYLQTSSWTASPLLLKRHLKLMPLVEPYEPEVLMWFCKKNLKRRRPLPVRDKEEAAFVLTGFFLCVYSRAMVVKAANNVYRKIKDEDSGVDFFANTISGETSW
eukprot:CAMPEP_0114418898 /NCGR_PEP_ID=MMETSP0103-20121206/3741_1 /TAXON_ID=37642 ORGANISM="Paraphysomonas imperforata, Strain PA2" /NCGR_SAMPLE_ID=MMETSP0103 /ASSEMBLY_ACC=CAM_ASM_000201 /LENGTH=358 /DNA_ID=CAMNT_0001587285 /DNA_START=33 /DNA_END=1106 /DNA_ORIENTATION=+